jgi:hypothetical protein
MQMSTTLNEASEQLRSLNKALSEVIAKKALDPESPDTTDLQFLVTKVQYACTIANKAGEMPNDARTLRELKVAIEDVLNDLKNPEIMNDIKNKNVDKLKVFAKIPPLTTTIAQAQPSFFNKADITPHHESDSNAPKNPSKRTG